MRPFAFKFGLFLVETGAFGARIGEARLFGLAPGDGLVELVFLGPAQIGLLLRARLFLSTRGNGPRQFLARLLGGTGRVLVLALRLGQGSGGFGLAALRCVASQAVSPGARGPGRFFAFGEPGRGLAHRGLALADQAFSRRQPALLRFLLLSNAVERLLSSIDFFAGDAKGLVPLGLATTGGDRFVFRGIRSLARALGLGLRLLDLGLGLRESEFLSLALLVGGARFGSGLGGFLMGVGQFLAQTICFQSRRSLCS